MNKQVMTYEDTSKFQKSYSGGDIDKTKIEISAYCKKCGSPSCIEIRVEESWETGNGRFMRRVVLHVLPKEKAIELRDMLNKVDF